MKSDVVASVDDRRETRGIRDIVEPEHQFRCADPSSQSGNRHFPVGFHAESKMPDYASQLHRKAVSAGKHLEALSNRGRRELLTPNEFRIERQAFAQRKAARGGLGVELADLRPSSLRIDEVFGDRRDAAPIIDARIQKPREIAIAKVRRSLNVHVRSKDDTRDSNRAQHVIERRLRMIRHGNLWLRAKILNDHFLNMTKFFLQPANCE